MKRVMLFVAALMIAAPALAQHVHDDAQAAPAGPPAGAPGGGQAPQTPPIDVPWNDAIPAGTADHAARALKESPRHGEWADIKMADGTLLKSWVVYPGAVHEDRRRARDPRHPRDVGHAARRRRSAGSGRLHRDRARLSVRQRAERRRDRIARGQGR